MKYKVKNNVFALGRLNKAGTEIDIDPEFEVYFKGQIEPMEEPKKKRVKKNADR